MTTIETEEQVALRERLGLKVDHSGGPNACWPCTSGAILRGGYRQIWWKGSMRLAHRLAFLAEHGEIPEGLCVCHSCDNPPCCNPAHLWTGTPADNNADRDRKGRGVPPPPGSRSYPSPGPITHGSLSGYVRRECRCDACRRRMREYRRERKAARLASPSDLPPT